MTSDATAKPTWDYVSVLANSPRVVNLLADGWEPFAVTVVPDGMRLHQHDGGTVYYVERLHLRRVTT